MSGPDEIDDWFEEQSALHAFGALAGRELEAFESAQAQSVAHRELVRADREVAALVGLGVDPIPVHPGLKRTLMERIRSAEPAEDARPWRNWPPLRPSTGLTVVRGDEGEWEPTGHDGVRARRLFVDPESQRITMLVKMDAGTSYPAHVHGGAEECFVLEGDLFVGDAPLEAGDYQMASEGSEHPVQWTKGGCLLLISCSSGDEFLDD